MGNPALVTDNIKAYWTFDSDAGEDDVDRIGGIIANDIGNNVARAPGKFGNAASFPNSGTTMNLPNDATILGTGKSNWSIVFWLHCTTRGTNNSVFRHGSGSPQLSYDLQYDSNGNWRCFRSTSGTSYNANTPAGGNWANGETALATYGFRSSGARCFVGENLSFSDTPGTTTFASSHLLTFGDIQNFNGWIDEVMFFDTDVSAGGIIQEIYNGGAGHPYSYYYPSTGRGSATFFSLSMSAIPAATLAGLFAKGAVAL